VGGSSWFGGDVTTSSMVNARNAGLTAVAVVAVAAMAWLGYWQFGAYQQHQSDDASSLLERAPIPLDDALGPDAAFPSDSVSRPVVVRGRYLGNEQFYVRDLGGDGRYAVATPVLTESRAAIIVVRGSVASIPVAAPSGQVRLRGVLEPSQASAAPLDSARTTDGIQIARLVSAFDHDLYAGYVVATAADPPDQLAPVAPPRPDASFWAGLRNLIYALQWWAFAGFVVFMWWRMIHDPIGPIDAGGDRAGCLAEDSPTTVAATAKGAGDRPS
jgi:cytochrome oxidase assembly protein ShyY1